MHRTKRFGVQYTSAKIIERAKFLLVRYVRSLYVIQMVGLHQIRKKKMIKCSALISFFLRFHVVFLWRYIYANVKRGCLSNIYDMMYEKLKITKMSFNCSQER